MGPTLEAWLEEGNREQSSAMSSVFEMQISSGNCLSEEFSWMGCEFCLHAIVLPE